ncbi:unnamed protein product [Scytosiphon promiscuus]
MLRLADAAGATAAAARRSSGKVAVAFATNSPRRNRRCPNQGVSALHTTSGRRLLGFLSLSSRMEPRIQSFRRRMSSSSSSPIVFAAPPDELEDGYFERPTPLLLVAGEGQPPSWWDSTASFLAARGCTVGTMALTGRGSSATDTLTLRALQAGVAAAVEKSGLTPPVIVAHSMAGFVCQQYLQSYSASGLVLLDSFPPSPRLLAREHVRLALTSDPNQDEETAKSLDALDAEELAELMKDDPARWERLLRHYFAEFHRLSPWQAATPPRHEDESGRSRPAHTDKGVEGDDGSLGHPPPDEIRFPVKAFAQMCLDERSSTLRLESHVVETLVLGSRGSHDDISGASLTGGGGKSYGRDALAVAKLDGLSEICDFHGTGGCSMVDREGLLVDGDTGSGDGSDDKVGSAEHWREAVWNWYDARF